MGVLRVSIFALVLPALLAGCLTTGFPESYSTHPVEKVTKKIQGREPIVLITFVSGVTAEAEAEFSQAYQAYPLEWKASSADDGVAASGVDGAMIESALSQMMGKTAFYAVKLQDYMIFRKGQSVRYLLNPVKIDYVDGEFVYKERYTALPHDIEIDLLAYVDPRTDPSTFSSVTTTFADSVAPIVSISTSRQYHPEAGGAVALTSDLARYARQTASGHVKAGICEYLNAMRREQTQASPLYQSISSLASSERPFTPGKYLNLPMRGVRIIFTDKEGSEAREKYHFRPIVEDPMFDVYFNIIADALNGLDFGTPDAELEQAYFELYEPSAAVQFVSLNGAADPKALYIKEFRKAEITFQVARDMRFAQDLLLKDGWAAKMDELRKAEMQAYDEYQELQMQQLIGVLAVMGGAIAAGTSDNPYVQGAGMAAAMIGIGVAIKAGVEMEAFAQAFEASYEPTYEEIASYTITAIDGEKHVIQPRNFEDLRSKMKAIYMRKFGPQASTGT